MHSTSFAAFRCFAKGYRLMKTLESSNRSSRLLIQTLARPFAQQVRFMGGCLAKACRIVTLAATIVAGGVVAGCTIPSDCGDLDYPTYGGAWQRTRRDSGRVGSVFDPAGARSATLSSRDLPESEGDTRSARDSILSTPDLSPFPTGPRGDDDPLRQPSPSDRQDPGRLRDLRLEDINTKRSRPLPADLN
jgi:hypothetical protein